MDGSQCSTEERQNMQMFHRMQQCIKAQCGWLRMLIPTALALSLMVLPLLSGFSSSSVATADNASIQSLMTAPSRPASFAELAQRLRPTVVHVKVTKVQQVEGWPGQGAAIPEGPFGELFKRFFKEMPARPAPQQQGTGSGVIISSGHGPGSGP